MERREILVHYHNNEKNVVETYTKEYGYKNMSFDEFKKQQKNINKNKLSTMMFLRRRKKQKN